MGLQGEAERKKLGEAGVCETLARRCVGGRGRLPLLAWMAARLLGLRTRSTQSCRSLLWPVGVARACSS